MNARDNLLIAAAFVLCTQGPAAACPFCEGKDGVNPVHAEIFNDNFLPTLLAVAAPFPLFLGVVAAIHFGRPSEREEDPVDHPHHTEERHE